MIATDFLQQIETHLQHLSPKEDDLCSQAVRYALLGGGKRFRPQLTLATVETLNGTIDLALSPACAIEMIHAYSMIHDDLPCMDDDDFRRGKPTVHKAFPEGIAVLAGDWLLTHAFDVIATAPGLSSDQRILLVRILAERSGGLGMIGGQVMDLDSEGKEISLETLQNIHLRKTGALISAAVEFGSVITTGEVNEKLRDFAKHLGLAFQIVDDILDVTNSEEKHGRLVGSDVIRGKATYVSLLGLEGAQQAALSHLEIAEQCLPRKNGALMQFIDRLKPKIPITTDLQARN